MYMGSTKIEILPDMAERNHPHVYGEYKVTAPISTVVLESSPCIWGVLEFDIGPTKFRGIIPMYMGSTRYDITMT